MKCSLFRGPTMKTRITGEHRSHQLFVFPEKELYSSKISCRSVHYLGFLAHHGEGYKLTCFSLAPKFKNGTKHSKLDPDEKTSPTSQKNFRSLRCSHCTWSR